MIKIKRRKLWIIFWISGRYPPLPCLYMFPCEIVFLRYTYLTSRRSLEKSCIERSQMNSPEKKSCLSLTNRRNLSFSYKLTRRCKHFQVLDGWWTKEHHNVPVRHEVHLALQMQRLVHIFLHQILVVIVIIVVTSTFVIIIFIIIVTSLSQRYLPAPPVLRRESIDSLVINSKILFDLKMNLQLDGWFPISSSTSWG